MNSLPTFAEQEQSDTRLDHSNKEPVKPLSELANLNRVVARRILLVEEDAAVAGFLSTELRSHGFRVDHVRDGEEALKMLQEGRVDLLILELNLPKIDGVNLIERIRPVFSRLPVLVVTSRTRVEDKVTALCRGADDYLTKPFSLMEFLARVRALLRRNCGQVPNFSQVGDLTMDREEHRVERDGRRIELTPREFALLDVMMQNAGHAVARTTLLEKVWSASGGPSTNVVDVYMKYVRDKIDIPGEPRLIQTVRGFGYELRANE